jgi:aspartate racemase
MIGIVGGVGPHAGVDLMKKVSDQTLAGSDQEHVDALLFSQPTGIPDRTEYLLGRVEENPGKALAAVLLRLEKAGATVAGIPCNTAHAGLIFNLILEILKEAGSRIRLLHMIRETLLFMAVLAPGVKRVGVLSTTGTYSAGIYRMALLACGYEPVLPPSDMQETLIHPAIYDPEYGIKSLPDRIHPRAVENLDRGFAWLESRDAEAVILGCTEIPLAFPSTRVRGMLTIDPTVALARALIRESFPGKLKPLNLEP